MRSPRRILAVVGGSGMKAISAGEEKRFIESLEDLLTGTK